MLLRLLEHVAHARGAHADEHLDEIGAGDREEGHLCLARDRLREQRLARSGIAHHQHAARDAPAQLLELRRVAEELDKLRDLFLGFLAARDVRERDGVVRLVEHTGAALAERERPAPPAALHLAHEEDPHPDQEQHREPRHEDVHEERRLLLGLRFDDHPVLEEIAHQPRIGR
jgi:hypothetical protein